MAADPTDMPFDRRLRRVRREILKRYMTEAVHGACGYAFEAVERFYRRYYLRPKPILRRSKLNTQECRVLKN